MSAGPASTADLFALLSASRAGTTPSHYTFDEKKAFAPETLANDMRRVIPDEWDGRLRPIFDGNAACRLVYRNDYLLFREDVSKAVDRLTKSGSPPVSHPNEIVPVPKPLHKWPEGHPGHSLVEAWDAVVAFKRHFPRGVPIVSDYRFSAEPLKSEWGFFRYSDRRMVISSTLNSPDVPLFVIEFMIYHEALHAEMPNSGHNSDFRRQEQKFTPSEKAVKDAESRNIVVGSTADAWRVASDQFLDTFCRKFSDSDKGIKMRY